MLYKVTFRKKKHQISQIEMQNNRNTRFSSVLLLPILLKISHLDQKPLSQFYLDLAKNSKLVFCDSHKNYQKSGDYHWQKFITSKLKRPEGENQDIGRTMLPTKSVGKNL